MAGPLDKVRGMAHGRNFTLLLDTAITALTTMVLVIVAARTLSAQELDSFSLGQLVVVTTIGIMRAAIYSPALAAQRQTGKARIPLTWTVTIGVPLALVISLGISPFMGLPSVSWSTWVWVMMVTIMGALAQDGARNVLVSREQEKLALVSDLTVLVLFLLVWVTGLLPSTAVEILLAWAGCGLVGLVVALVMLRVRPAATDLPVQSFRASWSLSKWASVDVALSSFATLLPYFVATATLDSNSTGVYRTLQTALGPLNIVHTTVITAFGLDSWRTATLEGIHKLRQSVSRLTTALVLGGAAYSVVAVILMSIISDLHNPHLHRIAIIMMVTATLGAANSGYNAAALALGYQRSGAILRTVIVAVTVLVSLPVSARTWVPWHDPIGTSQLGAGMVTFIGWALSYRIGIRAETEALEREAQQGTVPVRRGVAPVAEDVEERAEAVVRPRRALAD